MIVPMKKISLVVLDRERPAALAALRKLGVLHVERREASSEGLASLNALAERLDHSKSILSDYATAGKGGPGKANSAGSGKDYGPGSPERSATIALVDRVFALRDEKRAALERVNAIQREFDRLAAWGDVDPADVKFLAEHGVHLFPVEMSAKEYAALSESVRAIRVNGDRQSVRCLVWADGTGLPPDLPPAARRLELPAKSTSDMRADRAAALERIPLIHAELAEMAARLDSISALKETVLKEIEFERIRAGMPLVELGEAGYVTGSTGLAWLSGFVPAPREAELAAAAQAQGWGYLSSEPADDEDVPTQVRNNRVVNIISPLLDFLGTVPGYRELDISLWFLLFFGIFFAMIFGDGGYGSIISLIAAGAIVSSVRKGKGVPTALFMLLYLGVMTVIWGAVTCTWFGIPCANLPAFLRSAAIPAFSGENPESAINVKIFCFTLGLVQISLAHVIGIIRNRKSLKLLGELGSLLLAVGMYFVVLSLVVDAQKYPITTPVLSLVLGGFALNFLFINYAGSFGGGILESLKNVISMVLGVVNMFADIMSYIRLWAVGLAGAAISTTINTMAGPILGGFIVFAGIILLLFGHGLNAVMNVLSVLVHGVRLNTLEFSNHLGLTWSGFKYEPFAETANK